MKPNTKYSAGDIADVGWIFKTDSNGDISAEAFNQAMLIAIAQRAGQAAQLLRSINYKLDALGSDGIHDLIRIHTRELRRKEALRKKRLAAKRRAARLAKAAK